MTFALNLISATLAVMVLVGWTVAPFGSPVFWFALSFFSLGFSIITLMTALPSK